MGSACLPHTALVTPSRPEGAAKEGKGCSQLILSGVGWEVCGAAWIWGGLQDEGPACLQKRSDA